VFLEEGTNSHKCGFIFIYARALKSGSHLCEGGTLHEGKGECRCNPEYETTAS
jgi:hypothetical protein